MRFIRFLVIIFIVSLVGFYLLEKNELSPNEAVDQVSKILKEKKNMMETKEISEKRTKIPLEGDIFQWIGKDSNELTKELGEPFRNDLSAYGYTWWVYTDQKEQYVQFGVEENEVKSVYATGNNLSTEPVQIGQTYESMNNEFSFSEEVTYSKGISSYTFRLNEEDRLTRPLVKITNDVFVQYYFDTFTSKLSSIRLVTGDILLRHRPYEVEYRGSLPEKLDVSEEEWAEIESGMEQQIFDITNVMRKQYQKSGLQWEENVSEVAFLHSKDMEENQYFSHYGLNGDGLKERLGAKEIYYLGAGENIAAQYPDAPAAMEGWLNSKGHREALLKDDYTHLGVGVYRFYYTQNFLEKPL
ncbi:CAP domain-containing protein [Virgibacillus byunsanensis]|uniref:CAP domain-containing protein n=1 Tax=Virgibacillus byunsanensis TaxID=570945 RepID=A0ABW3LPC3_9BACI